MRTLRLLLPTLLLLLALPTAAPRPSPRRPPQGAAAGDRPSRRDRATARSTRWPRTAWRSSWAPTSSSPTWSAPRTACSSPATRTRSAAPPTWPTTPSSPAAAPRRRSTASRHRLVHRGLHAGRAQDAAREGAAPGSARATRRTTASSRSPRSRRSSRCASELSRKAPRPSASTRRPSTRPTSARSGCRWRSRWSGGCRRHGLDRPNAPVFVQSFETGNLRRARRAPAGPAGAAARRAVRLPRRGGPDATQDLRASRDPGGPGEIATYADGVGPPKDEIGPWNADGSSGTPTSLVGDAHGAGLASTRTRSGARTRSCRWSCARRTTRPASATSLSEIRQFLDLGSTGSSPTTRTTASGPAPSIASMPQVAHRVAYPRLSVLPGGQPAGERTAAVIDLGSNSWRLVVYAYGPGAPGAASASCRSPCGSRPARGSGSLTARDRARA